MLYGRAPSELGVVDPEADQHIRDELAALLFGSVGPTAIIGTALAVLSAMSATTLHGWLGAAMPVLAVIVGTFRVALVIAFRRRTAPKQNISRWEAAYSAGIIAFALLVGAFCLDAFQRRDPLTQMMAITILVGFCAGVVTRISVRPRLAAAALSLASLPAVAGCALTMVPQYLAVGAVLFTLMAGSLGTVRETYNNIRLNLVLRRQFEELAGLDPLTGLVNRAILHRRLDALLAIGKGTLAVHFLDLDLFKAVNDTHGHAAGDTVLREVASRLSAASYSGMIVARLGGDEFVVVQPDIAFAEEARLFGRRIVEIVSQPIPWSGGDIRIGASVGCAVAEGATMTAETAIALADRALYAAKQKGRGGVVMADPTALAA